MANDRSNLSNAAIRRGLPWMVVIASIIIGYGSVIPPASLPDSTDLTLFSAERSSQHVDVIASQPHPMGSPAIEEVRAYITAELEALGLEVDAQRIMRPSYYEDRIVPVVNLTARIPGTASSGTIALVGHYDTFPETAGANDNSAAVATLLETGRALLAGTPVRNDILLLFTDSEEPAPRYGAVAFVGEYPSFADLSLFVNLEANGGHGASLLVETSGPEKWLIEHLSEVASRPAAFSFLPETARLLGDIGTDFDEFRNAGVKGFHFAYLQGSSIYHTPGDNIDALSLGSMQHHGDHALGIARHFGSLDLGVAPPDQGAVFFSLPPVLVVYSTSWVIPLMLLAVAGSASGLAMRHRTFGTAPIHRPGLGFLFGAGAVVTGTVAWLVVVAIRPSLGLIEAYLAFALITALATTGIAWANQRFRPGAVRDHGSMLPLLALTALTAFAGVGFSYLFALPALAAAIALWLGNYGIGKQTRFAVVAVVTLLLSVPAIDVFLQFASPRPGNPDSNMAAAIVVPLALALLAIGVLRGFWPESTGHSPSEG